MNESVKDRSHSIWEDVALPEYSSLKENTSTQVCVVGGGIAGVSTAYQLGKRGFKVILLEADKIASGQTGRTTAHLTSRPEELLADMLKQHSKGHVSAFIDSHKRAIDEIEEIIFQENISCDFKRIPGYLFLGDHNSEKDLEQEASLAQELGLEAEYVEKIPGFPQFGAAVKYENQAQFNPTKYIQGLLRALKELDVEVYENSHVKEFATHRGLHKVVCDGDNSVEAKYLVVATDSPVNNRYLIHTKQSAYRSYVVGFHLKDKMDIPLMWDTSDPYHYIRRSGETLILGGEDHRTGQNPDSDPYKELVAWAEKNLSIAGTPVWAWSGQVFESVDGIAYIGKNPGMEKNVFIVTGQSGIGMTSGTIASLIIPDLIEEKHNYMIKIFDPARSFLHNPKEFIKENANTAFQYKDWITSSEVKKLEEIPEDHGSIVRDGVVKNCVYHAKGDEFETKSAVCPHLGGIVKWNDIEKTWDCPCHGSRFNVHGKVIEGPSLHGLAEI